MAERVDRRKRYSDEQRRVVLADIARLGVRGAGREHGIPSGTVARWKAQVAALAAALARNKVSHQLVTVQGAGHGLSGGDPKEREKAHQLAVDFVKLYVK